jgi:hypothetical protein
VAAHRGRPGRRGRKRAYNVYESAEFCIIWKFGGAQLVLCHGETDNKPTRPSNNCNDRDEEVLPVTLPKFIRKNILSYAPLPMPLKIDIERWLRGREECYRLGHADAVVVSYEKCGRTWLRVMLSNYYQRRYRLPVDTLLNYNNLHRLRAEVPAVLFTHDRYLRYYTGQHGRERSKFNGKPVILLVRDPRDVAVSLYFHWLHRLKPHNKWLDDMPLQGSEISMYDFVMRPESGVPAIIAFMNRWLQQGKDTPQLAIYRYEDFRTDTGKQLEQVLRTLGEQPTAEEVTKVVAYADFEKMKRREQNGQISDTRLKAGDVNNPDSFKARRAKVGGYRDYFDARQIELIDRLVDTTLDPAFDYCAPKPGN